MAFNGEVYAIKIPERYRCLVLDDSQKRLEWFAKQIASKVCITTVKEAIDMDKNFGPFNAYFLDHDLGLLDFSGVPGEEGNGEQFAKYLASTGNKGGNVVIHSWNDAGAARMKSRIPNAFVRRFGTFRIDQTSA